MPEEAPAREDIRTPLGDASGPRALPDTPVTPFAMLGLEPRYALDADDLRRRLVRISRWLHPDFYAGDAERRALAERNTAELNAAHALLADDHARASWLVRHLGGPGEDEERQMPQAFLMEVLEWNEVLEAARGSEPGTPARAALDELEPSLRDEREGAFQTIAELLEPLPPAGDARLVEVRKQLNAVRYLDRALRTVQALRLDIASEEGGA